MRVLTLRRKTEKKCTKLMGIDAIITFYRLSDKCFTKFVSLFCYVRPHFVHQNLTGDHL
jgi:hypothetical protein